jgi:hypothetical protein
LNFVVSVAVKVASYPFTESKRLTGSRQRAEWRSTVAEVA